MSSLVGKRLGRFEVVEQIGHGSVATVYKAYEPAWDRFVAIKVFSTAYTKDPEFEEQFRRQLRTVGKLSHPNIWPLIEWGRASETLFLVMSLAREGTLLDLLKQRREALPLKESIAISMQLCDAVQYAHEQGVVHQHITPQNVFMQGHTHIFLTDFGFAPAFTLTRGCTRRLPTWP